MRIMISAALFSLATLGAAHAAPTSPVHVSADPADLVGCDMQHADTSSGSIRYRCQDGAYLQVEGAALVRHAAPQQSASAPAATPAALSAYAMSDDQWNAKGVIPEGCIRVVDPEHPDWFSTCKVIQDGQLVARIKRDIRGREIPSARVTLAASASVSPEACGKQLTGRPTQEMVYRQGSQTGCVAVREKSRIPEMLVAGGLVIALEAVAGNNGYGYRGGYQPRYDSYSTGGYSTYGYRGETQSMGRPGDPAPGYGGNYVRQ